MESPNTQMEANSPLTGLATWVFGCHSSAPIHTFARAREPTSFGFYRLKFTRADQLARFKSY